MIEALATLAGYVAGVAFCLLMVVHVLKWIALSFAGVTWRQPPRPPRHPE